MKPSIESVKTDLKKSCPKLDIDVQQPSYNSVHAIGYVRGTGEVAIHVKKSSVGQIRAAFEKEYGKIAPYWK